MWGWLGGLGAGQVHSEDSQEVTAANRRRGQTYGIFQNRLCGKILMIFSQLYREVPGKEVAPSFLKILHITLRSTSIKAIPAFT